MDQNKLLGSEHTRKVPAIETCEYLWHLVLGRAWSSYELYLRAREGILRWVSPELDTLALQLEVPRIRAQSIVEKSRQEVSISVTVILLY